MNVNVPSLLLGAGIGGAAAVLGFVGYKKWAKQKPTCNTTSQDTSAVWSLPIALLTDSYKAAHFEMYPDATTMVAYGEFRTSFEKSKTDQRMVFYGIRYLVETYLHRQWTLDDVDRAEKFYNEHNGGKSFPFPKHLFLKFIKENNGYFPIKLETLPEGSVVHVHTPVYQITASGEYSLLCTFLETLLTQVWYPTSVATLSAIVKGYIREAFLESVDDDSMFLLDSRLHDFGFRGTTCLEQSVLGGTAHLLNFTGSDTMSACYYAQFHLNHGKAVGQSIPATEHSVMTAWRTEKEAIDNMIDRYGTGIFATVMDSYDYDKALNEIVPAVAEKVKAKGGLWVLRPDSGDPVEAVLSGLRAAERAFGSNKNKKGYKVIPHAAVIQGDGINKDTVQHILAAVLKEGYSAQNVCFGMGGGLLQKVNRDTMGFATKLAFIKYTSGVERDIMKVPKTDSGKISLPGILRVKRIPSANGPALEQVFPCKLKDASQYDDTDILRVVYDHKPVAQFDDFDTVRERVKREWLAAPKLFDPISPPLKQKIEMWLAEHKKMA